MRSALFIPVTTLLFLSLLATATVAGSAGDAGALFLRIGMGGRAAAMGEAFTAVAEDASSVYWNPASMAAVLGTHMMLMHNEYMQSVRLEQVVLSHETSFGTFGLGFTGLYTNEMDRYESVPSSVPLGTFSAYDIAVTIGFARYILPNLSAGFSMKPVYQKLDESSSKGMAFDVGLYHVSRIPGMKLAAVLVNLGAPMKFEAEEYALPRVFKVGGSYEREVTAVRGAFLLAADVLFPNDGDARAHFGLEYDYSGRLFLRAGYKAGYESQGATFGLGVMYRKLALDYAVLLISNDLGDSHRISLAFSL